MKKFNELSKIIQGTNVNAGSGHIVSRKYEYFENESYSFKYQEEIDFIGSTNNKKAICVGFNPAKAEKNIIDVTNKRLINSLWGLYSGYTLVNIYPQISPTKDECDTTLQENTDFECKLLQFLRDKKEDIILFFGRTTTITDDFKELIVEKNTSIYITSHNNNFVHPASNAEIKIVKLSLDRVKTANYIK